MSSPIVSPYYIRLRYRLSTVSDHARISQFSKKAKITQIPRNVVANLSNFFLTQKKFLSFFELIQPFLDFLKSTLTLR